MTIHNQKLRTFPVFIRTTGRIVVIVGGGGEALAKARLLAQSNAMLRIAAEGPSDALAEWAIQNGVDLVA
ncbi:MAG: uroporphyrinogen-III C-methyltransferase, partial [Rhizobiaceae bacterium]